jgi:DNA polymerase-3 subunit delta
LKVSPLILQSIDALKKDLKSTYDRSFYLVLGPEQYQCRLAVNLIKSEILSPGTEEFDYCKYSAKDTPLERIFETANTFPMLSKRRFVLVTELEKIDERKHEELIQNLDSLSRSSMVLLVADELDHRKKLYRTIRDKGCIVEFSQIKGEALKRWVEDFVRDNGYRISSTTAGKIANLVGSDLQSLAGELEKLFLFSEKEKTITDATVEVLVRSSRQHGIFELIDAIGMRDRAGALDSLSNLLVMGEYPPVIVAMMSRHSRQVLILKECLQKGMSAREAAAVAQIPHFLLDKFVRQARAMKLETVHRMHIGLSEIDRRLKSSSVDVQILLEVFICALM